MYLAIASPRFLPLKNTLGSEVLAALHVRAWQRALLAELGGFACVSGKNVYLLLGDGSRSSGAPISELPRIASRGLPNVGLAHVAFRPSDVRGGLTQTVGHLLLWAANLTSIAAWDSSVDAIGAVRTALSDPSARQVCLDAALTYPCLGHSEAGLHSRVGEEQGRALGGGASSLRLTFIGIAKVRPTPPSKAISLYPERETRSGMPLRLGIACATTCGVLLGKRRSFDANGRLVLKTIF